MSVFLACWRRDIIRFGSDWNRHWGVNVMDNIVYILSLITFTFRLLLFAVFVKVTGVKAQ